MHWSDVLLIGVEDNNKDEIWRYGTGDLNETCSKLANNIFEFISKLNESIDYENLDTHNIEVEQIYRNLNETFWRVKPK
jgi:tRNA U34 5-carboxymethylaminomethyl modifying GTPase MnmE/TrmE